MKKIIAVIVAAVLVAGGIGAYVYHSAQVKKENLAICKKKAKEIRMSSVRLIYGMKFIVDDYTTNWDSSIKNGQAINMSNKIVDCDDFSKAMSWRWSFYDSLGSFHRIDSCQNKMNGDLSVMAKNEECNKQLVTYYEKELDLLEKLKIMSKKPNGSLLEYSQKVSPLFNELYELDDKISKIVPIPELEGNERTKNFLCDMWGEGLLDYPKVKTKVIKVTAKDMLFIDLKDNLNMLSNQEQEYDTDY